MSCHELKQNLLTDLGMPFILITTVLHIQKYLSTNSFTETISNRALSFKINSLQLNQN